MQSAAEKRKNLRRTVSYPAYIDLGDGSPARACTLCDASQDGAQLALADPNSLPNEFVLALSSDGAARRRCRVIWRTETEVGVKFLKEVKKSSRAGRAWMRPIIPELGATGEAAGASDRDTADTIDIDPAPQG